MIEIFQIGHHRVKLFTTDMQDIGYETGMKFRRAVDKITHVPGVVSHSDPGLPLVDDLKWKVKGTLLCGDKGCGPDRCESMWNDFQSMLATAGGPVRLIGVHDADNCYCSECGFSTASTRSGCCGTCGAMKFAQWMTTCVEVTEIKRAWDWELSQPMPYHAVPIEMSLAGAIYWEPLDDIRWRYWHRNRPSWTMTTGGDTEADDTPCTGDKQYHPRSVPRKAPCSSGFQYLDRQTAGEAGPMLYPENWVIAYDNENKDQTARAFVSDILAAPISHQFTPPIRAWSAPPRSLYYFGGFADLELRGKGYIFGTLSIQVTGALHTGWEVTNQATLDLDLLHANLISDGFGGISPYDRVLVGATAQGGGAYLRRTWSGSYIILDTYVPWVYNGLYPGQTYAGHNIISAQGMVDEFAYLHVYRSY